MSTVSMSGADGLADTVVTYLFAGGTARPECPPPIGALFGRQVFALGQPLSKLSCLTIGLWDSRSGMACVRHGVLSNLNP